eukprot:3503510-Prymnesium_polylepis.1
MIRNQAVLLPQWGHASLTRATAPSASASSVKRPSGVASYNIASASSNPTSASTRRVSANTSRMHALASRTTPSASQSKV